MNNIHSAPRPFPTAMPSAIELPGQNDQQNKRVQDYFKAEQEKQSGTEAIAILEALLQGIDSFVSPSSLQGANAMTAPLNVPFLEELSEGLNRRLADCHTALSRLDRATAALQSVLAAHIELESAAEMLLPEGFLKLAAHKAQLEVLISVLTKRDQEWKEAVLQVAPLLYPTRQQLQPVLVLLRIGKAELHARRMTDQCKQAARLTAWNFPESAAERIAKRSTINLADSPKNIGEFYVFALTYHASVQGLLNEFKDVLSRVGGEIPSESEFRGFVCPCGCNQIMGDEVRLNRFA